MSWLAEWHYRDREVREAEYLVHCFERQLNEAKEALKSARAFRKEWENREENYND